MFAEALARRRYASAVRVASAGLRAQRPADAQNAVDTLRFEFRIDAAGHVPRDITEFDIESFQIVVAMDPTIARGLNALSAREIIVWNISDPWGGDIEEYRQCALKIMQQVGTLPVASSTC